MNFKSRKDRFFSLFIFGTIGSLLLIIGGGILFQEDKPISFWGVLITLLSIGLLLWFFFGTHYKLTATKLIYRSGPIRGEIEVDRIKEIVVGKTLWVGIRPATAMNGLIIKYDSFNEIYISPITNESFIKEISTLNSSIKITHSH